MPKVVTVPAAALATAVAAIPAAKPSRNRYGCLGSQGCSQGDRCNRDTPLLEERLEIRQRARDAHTSSVLADAQCRTDFLEFLALEEPDQHRIPLARIQLAHGFIEHQPQLGLVRLRFGRGGLFLHRSGYLFAELAAMLPSDDLGSRKPGAGVEPAGEQLPSQQGTGFPGQINKHGLGHVLGQGSVAVSLTQCRRIDQRQMAANQFRKGRLGTTLGVLAQEFGIFTHSSFTL